jgi:hypothetical protein
MLPNFREFARLCGVLAAAALFSSGLMAQSAAAEDPLYRIEVSVASASAAHPSGTLIQAKDQFGRIRLTAGIERSFNTNNQSDPKQLTVSFDDGTEPIVSETFAGPNGVHHGSLYRLGGHTFIKDSFSEKIYERNEIRNIWTEAGSERVLDLYCGADAELCAALSSGCDQLLDVTRTVLRMRRCAAVDGRLVWLERGLTEFAGVTPSNLAPVFVSDEALVLGYIADAKVGTGVVICRLPGGGVPKPSDCFRSAYGDEQDFPYSIVDTGEDIVVFSTYGSVKRFNVRDGSVKEIRKANEPLKDLGTTSYQIYSALSTDGSIFLGGYPFSITQKFRSDGTIADFDAPLPQTFNYGEVQTAVLFKNHMLAGTWPWGQLWSWDFAKREWALVKRLFSHPKIEAVTDLERLDEPYVKKAGANQLGQRIVSMKKDRDALYVMTSAKDGYMRDFAAKAGLSGAQLDEYGAVHKFTATGQLALSLDDNIHAGDVFTIELTENYLRIFRDGRPIGSAVVKITDKFCLQRASIGTGLLGNWAGARLTGGTATGTLRCQ